MAETRQILSWLNARSPDALYRNSVEKRLPGTCDWIFHRQPFQNWLDQDLTTGAELLWINGPAGFGKTILSAHIVDQLSSTLKTPVAYFFSSDVESREGPFAVVRSWISQVALQHEGVLEHVRQRWRADSNSVATRENAIMLFKQLLHLVPGCTFIVDGLDEYNYGADYSDSTSIVRFLHTITDAIVGTNTRILVVSRAEPEIRYALTNDTFKNVIEYKISPDDVRSDTAAYSRAIVDIRLPNKSEGLRSDLSKAMNERCNGQFLWLQMQINSLRKGMNKMQLRRVIAGAPAELSNVYDRSWQRITNVPELERQRIYTLLRWVAFGLRPMTVNEITEAVIINESDDPQIDELPDVVDDLYIDSEIIAPCGSFLEVRSQHSDTPAGLRTVHLTHFSIKEYLLHNLPLPGWIRKNEHLWEEYQHTLLSKACFYYINFYQDWGEAPDSESYLGRGFRNYVATFWHHHIKSGLRADPELLALIIPLFDRRNDAWNAWRALLDEQDTEHKKLGTGSIPPSPLYYAVKLDLTDVAIALIKEQSWNVNEGIELGRTVLELACAKGSEEVVKTLLDANSNLSAAGKDGWTPLHSASRYGHAEVVKLLISKGAKITVTDENGWTPMHAASLNGHIEVVKLFIEMGVDPDSKSNSGRTVLSLAAGNGHEDLVQLLLKKGSHPDSKSSSGRTPLSFSAEGGQEAVVERLLQCNTEVDSIDKKKWTPLLWAASRCHVAIARLLIERHADVNVVADGICALSLATKGRNEDLLKLLLSSGADIEVAQQTLVSFDDQMFLKQSALDYAIVEGHLAMVKALISARVDLNYASKRDDKVPLHLAAECGRLDVVTTLLDADADPTRQDQLARTAVDYANRAGYASIAQVLEIAIDQYNKRFDLGLCYRVNCGGYAVQKVPITRRMSDYTVLSDILCAYKHRRCRGLRRYSLKGLQDVKPVKYIRIYSDLEEPATYEDYMPQSKKLATRPGQSHLCSIIKNPPEGSKYQSIWVKVFIQELASGSDSDEGGFGILCIEDWLVKRIAGFAVTCVVGAGLIGILWATMLHNTSDGFAIAGCLIAAEALIISLMLFEAQIRPSNSSSGS